MEPERTCVGCGTKRPKDQLLRLARKDGTVTVDVRAVQPGRGAYVCIGGQCLESRMAGRQLGRSLRMAVSTADLAALTTIVRSSSNEGEE